MMRECSRLALEIQNLTRTQKTQCTNSEKKQAEKLKSLKEVERRNVQIQAGLHPRQDERDDGMHRALDDPFQRVCISHVLTHP